jgi:PilZ domain-containing protein
VMSGRKANGTGGIRRSATRFAIQIPLRYRTSGETNWHGGKIENISRSGVLFRAEHRLEPKTPVEMSFVLPAEIGGEGGAEVICGGYIVRTVEPLTRNNLPGLAAAILDYRFLRRKKPAGS